MTEPGTHDASGAAVPWPRALRVWGQAARPILERTARSYHSWITYGDLADQVQAGTGIRTRKLIHYWVGEVAYAACRSDEPILSSLVVDSSHRVGEGYLKAVLDRYGPPPPDDLQWHAAEERLKCHKFFGAVLPSDGGQPLLPPREAKRVQAVRARPLIRQTCPTCHLLLPLSGQCDICG